MMRYQLSTPFGDVTVSLDARAANDRVVLIYDGQADGVKMVRQWLSRQYGAFGHGIGDATSPIDLHAAMQTSEAGMFAPELVEGADLAASYEPALGDDAIT